MNTHFNPVFIGHGSPMNAAAANTYTKFLGSYGAAIGKPEAVVVISAHWQTRGTFVTGSAQPPQIYDFYGFPDELYALEYTPKGSPEIARQIASGTGAGASETGSRVDPARGIDHAGWAVVKHMYPEGDVPLLEISLDANLTEAEHLALGQKLAPFADRGILFLGSGNVVHNLRDISFDDDEKPFGWAVDADRWIGERIETGNTDALVNYKTAMPDWRRSIPTSEHFLPLLYILGMCGDGQKARTIYEEMQNGSISMRCVELTQVAKIMTPEYAGE